MCQWHDAGRVILPQRGSQGTRLHPGSPRTSPHSEPRALLHSVLQYPCSGPVFCSLACPFFTPGFCSDCRARPPASSPCCPSARRSGFLWLQPAAQVTSRTLSLLQLPLFADASLGNVVLGTGAMVSWVLTPLSSGLIVSTPAKFTSPCTTLSLIHSPLPPCWLTSKPFWLYFSLEA